MKKVRVRITVLSMSLLTAAVLFWKPPNASGQPPYYFTGLGGGGDLWSIETYGASDGTNVVVVGMAKNGSGNEQAYRWTRDAGLVGLGFLSGGSASNARGVSTNGYVIVGTSQTTGGYEAFHWTDATGMLGIGDLPGDPFRSYARAVSGDGSVIVGSGNVPSGQPGEAFRWQGGVMTGLGDLPGGEFRSEALGVSADGSVVVGRGYSTLAEHEPFRWTQATGMVGLGGLPGYNRGGFAYGVSADGSIVVGYAIGDGITGEAFRWTQAGGMVGLGDFPGGDTSSIAYGISDDGKIIVGRGATGTIGPEGAGQRAFIWTEDWGFRDLKDVLVNDFGMNLTGWTLSEAVGISRDGQNIVGYGYNPSGQREGWLAHIPEPSACVLLAAAFGLLPTFRRPRR